MAKRGKEKAKGSNPKSGLIPKYKKIQKMDFTYERFSRLDLWPITPGITGDGGSLSDNVKGLLFCNHFGYACWEQDGSVLLTDLPDKPTNKSLSDKEWIRWINRDNEEAKFNQLLDAAFRSRTLKNFGSKKRPEVKPFEFLTWLIQKGYPIPSGLIEKWGDVEADAVRMCARFIITTTTMASCRLHTRPTTPSRLPTRRHRRSCRTRTCRRCPWC